MPTVLRIGPHRFFFFSNEGNEPAHIHVETAEKYAKFWLSPLVLAAATGYNAQELRQIRELVQQHSEAFLEKWYEYFSNK